MIDDGGTGEMVCLMVFVAYLCIAFLSYPLWIGPGPNDPGDDS